MLAKILSMVLYFAIMFGVLIGGILLLKKYVFPKVRINKYIPLTVAVILFIVQFALQEKLPFWGGTAITIGAVLAFFWFWEIQQTGGPKASKEKKIVIKSKAKPNRVKKNK